MTTLNIFILSATLGQQQYKGIRCCVSIATVVSESGTMLRYVHLAVLLKAVPWCQTLRTCLLWKFMSLPDFRRPNYGVIGINILEQIPL
jgi:hypothetical protein